MEVQHVPGKNKGHIMVYALSTCGWCKRTKNLLNELGVDFYFVDVDLLGEEEKKNTKAKILEWNPSCSFPTIVIDDENAILGFDEDKIREELGDE